MKKTLIPILTSLFVLALLAITSLAVSAGSHSFFIGVWVSTDVDGSAQRLVIGGGPHGSYHVFYYDRGASVCGVDPDTGEILYAAMARGTGTFDGSAVTGNFPLWCLSHPRTFWGDTAFAFTYNPADDTLSDGWGTTWYRK